MWRRYFVSVLRKTFATANNKNPGYSVRAFAKKAGVGAGTISELLRDRRQVSPELALAIADKLKFTPEAIQHLQSLIAQGELAPAATVGSARLLDVVMHSLYFKILASLEVLPATRSNEQLADFVGASLSEVESALSVLRGLGIVEGVDLVSKSTRASTVIGADRTDDRTRSFHMTELRQTTEALINSPADVQCSCVIFGANPQKIEAIKLNANLLCEEAANSASHAVPDQVFELSIQLRPISKKFDSESGDLEIQKI